MDGRSTPLKEKMDMGSSAGLAFMGIVASIFILSFILALCGDGEDSSSHHHAAKTPSAGVRNSQYPRKGATGSDYVSTNITVSAASAASSGGGYASYGGGC